VQRKDFEISLVEGGIYDNNANFPIQG
jgi:hypothetical protein